MTEISPEGVLSLQDGRQVRLDGIFLTPEGRQLLSVLVRGKDLEVELSAPDSSPAVSGSSPEEVIPVYLYFTAQALAMPFAAGEAPQSERVFVNEWLVRTGAARVDEKTDPRHREVLLKAQEMARSEGQGIWSYEMPRALPSKAVLQQEMTEDPQP